MSEQDSSSLPSSSQSPHLSTSNNVYPLHSSLTSRELSTPTQDTPEIGNPKSDSSLVDSSRSALEGRVLPEHTPKFLEKPDGNRISLLGENEDALRRGKRPSTDLGGSGPSYMEDPCLDEHETPDMPNSNITPEQDTTPPSWPLQVPLVASPSRPLLECPSGTHPTAFHVLDSALMAEPPMIPSVITDPELPPSQETDEIIPAEPTPQGGIDLHSSPFTTPIPSMSHIPYAIHNAHYRSASSSIDQSSEYTDAETHQFRSSGHGSSSSSSNAVGTDDEEYDEYLAVLNHAFQHGHSPGQNTATIPEDSDSDNNEGKLFEDCDPSTIEFYRSVRNYPLTTGDIHDTKKFYLTDDNYEIYDDSQRHPVELNDIDFHDFYEESNSHALPHITGPSVPETNPGHMYAEEDIYDDEDVEQDQGPDPVSFTMHTDSMDPHFLRSVYPSIPAEVNSLAEAQQSALDAVYGTQDPIAVTENPPRYIRTSIGSVELPPNLSSQKVQEVFNSTSAQSGTRRGMFIIPRIGRSIFVDGTTIAMLEGSQPAKVFPNTPETSQFLLNFLLNNPFPWTFVVDPVVRIGELQADSPAPDPAPTPALLPDHEYINLHKKTEYSSFYIEPSLILEHFPPHVAGALLAHPLAPEDKDTYIDADGYDQVAYESNLTIEQFIKQWLIRSHIPPHALCMNESFVPISTEAANVRDWKRPEKITRPDSYKGEVYDIQQIPWEEKLRVDREDARYLRDRLYTAYRNLDHEPHWCSRELDEREHHFREKNMYSNYKASMSHFQLRNLMSVTSHGTVQYARRSKIFSATPFYNEKHALIDLSTPTNDTSYLEPVRISAMKAKHGVTVAGGFCGEYAVRADFTNYKTVTGVITDNVNGITNHVDIVPHRTRGSPQAVFASNDKYIRVLDCETDKFVQKDKLYRAINCTDTSMDGRLRVVVGDAADAWVLEAETSKPIQPLRGHRDFGFACAWSPDMIHIATSNQDKTVNIWDARTWRILQTIESDVAGYRSLRFSPVGGGPRTLLMCEPADRISVVNAQTYQSRQVFDFFGEIGGADYSPDGTSIWVANMDSKFGGLMEFERREWGQKFGLTHTQIREIQDRGDDYYPDLPNEWIPEADLDDDDRCMLSAGERRVRHMQNMSDDELDRFII